MHAPDICRRAGKDRQGLIRPLPQPSTWVKTDKVRSHPATVRAPLVCLASAVGQSNKPALMHQPTFCPKRSLLIAPLRQQALQGAQRRRPRQLAPQHHRAVARQRQAECAASGHLRSTDRSSREQDSGADRHPVVLVSGLHNGGRCFRETPTQRLATPAATPQGPQQGAHKREQLAGRTCDRHTARQRRCCASPAHLDGPSVVRNRRRRRPRQRLCRRAPRAVGSQRAVVARAKGPHLPGRSGHDSEVAGCGHRRHLLLLQTARRHGPEAACVRVHVYHRVCQ